MNNQKKSKLEVLASYLDSSPTQKKKKKMKIKETIKIIDMDNLPSKLRSDENS